MAAETWMVVGGDCRSLWMAEELRNAGMYVRTMGLEIGDASLKEAAQADKLLFPYPFSVKNGLVPTLSGITLHPEDVLSRARPGTVVLAGRGLEGYMQGDLILKRYMNAEKLSAVNADISAEAAVYEVMQRTVKALIDLQVLVTGYGLFGRALARKLKGLGAKVWIAARRQEQRFLAEEDGMKAIALSQMADKVSGMDFILNTIPAQILTEAIIRRMNRETVVLELASAPYCMDPEQARDLGMHFEVLPALPARYAPISAGKALAEAAMELLGEG